MRFALFLALVVACSNGPRKPHDATPAPTVEPAQVPAAAKVYMTGSSGEVSVAVEVVATRPLISKGLMYREHLPPDDGMLFIMEDVADHTFYMRNTLIPLDMIFIAPDLTIAGIVENATPRTETLRSVGAPSRYVLEVNGGWTAAKQIKAGTKVRFEGVPPVPTAP